MNKSNGILVIGGTGFIGYHIVSALLEAGCSVGVMCRNAEKAKELFSDRATIISADINTLHTSDYIELLRDFDSVVFAAGADERSKVQGDASEFFYRANVWPCEQLFAAVPQTNIKRAVLLSSIFAWLVRQKPDMDLMRHHPYIRSRVLQNSAAHSAIKSSDCILNTLEIPWIFGSSPHQISQWSGLVNYVRGAVPLRCIRGGANMMSVQGVARAALGALRYPKHSGTMPIGDENVSYIGLMQRLSAIAGRAGVRVSPVSDGFFQDLTALGNYFSEKFGMQGGIDLRHMSDLLLMDIFFDPADAQRQLHYAGGDLAQALHATVSAVPEGVLMKGWRRGLRWLGQ